MLAEQVRSGLVETSHDGAVAIVDETGSLIARHGDIDRPFFLRSAAKPFQALVSMQAGAGLSPLELAMASSSHRGFPVQIALVGAMLESVGLDESMLGCPADWPIHPTAARLVARSGATVPRRIWHNCSGKHAGFLRACVGSGWPVDSYLDPAHPLQERVVATVSELGGHPADPVGVDGCGAPVLRTTARAMATMFARLAVDPDLSDVLAAMHRYPALIGGNGEGDTEMAIASDVVAKGGAAGCVGVAVRGRLGVAVKSWDGLGTVANIGAIAALEQLGVLSPTGRAALAPLASPVVLGGGRPVGLVHPVFTLEMV
ncbi:MAG TPA: asparaginase [Acidimicrobiia bacterium]